MNVARLAGLPETCVSRAITMSDQFERNVRMASQPTTARALVKDIIAAASAGAADRLRALGQV